MKYNKTELHRNTGIYFVLNNFVFEKGPNKVVIKETDRQNSLVCTNSTEEALH